MNLRFPTMRFRRATLLLALAATAACATTADSWQQQLEQRGYRVTDETAEIMNYRLDGWNALDDQHLIIHSGPGTRYLVTFRTACHGLRSNETIAFSNTVNRLTKFDKAIVRGPGGIVDNCYIESIHRLEKLPKS